MKENDGKAALNRRLGFAWRMIGILSFLVGIILYNVSPPSMRNRNSSSPGMLGNKGIHNIRKNRPYYPKKASTRQEELQLILEAKVTLIGIGNSPNALAPSSSPGYGTGITAIFCPIDWQLQKTNPSTVPMFKDLISQSKHCSSQQIKVDILDIVQQAKTYDNESTMDNDNNRNKDHRVKVHAMKPKGFVFHETRCGSTLVANSLAAFDPLSNRVFSESPPPVAALKACTGRSSRHCDTEKAAQLFRDVVYLMGRTSDVHETNLFFKMQSVSVQSISVFTKAFPTTPWMFVYRDSVEVMMSHYKNKLKGGAVCTRAKSHPPPLLQQVVDEQSANTNSVSKLSIEEFCAVHLASLSKSALDEYQQQQQEEETTRYGTFVNYNQLPQIMWESILPTHFGFQDKLTKQHAENIQKVSGFYSKGRDHKANKEWKEDSTKKQESAPEVVQQAANTYMKPYFDQMEELNPYK